MNASFHILSNLLFTIHPPLWRSVLWVTDRVVKYAINNGNKKRYGAGKDEEVVRYWGRTTTILVPVAVCLSNRDKAVRCNEETKWFHEKKSVLHLLNLFIYSTKYPPFLKQTAVAPFRNVFTERAAVAVML
jgi:hypothetical protein